MNKVPTKEVQVDLGEAGILVLQFKSVLTEDQRNQVQRVLEQVAANPGRQTIVLEDDVQYSVIPREPKS